MLNSDVLCVLLLVVAQSITGVPVKNPPVTYQEEAYPDGYGDHGFDTRESYPKPKRGPCYDARDNGNIETSALDPCAYLECVYMAHNKVGFQQRRCPPGTRFSVVSLICDIFDNGCNMATHPPVYPPKKYVHQPNADTDDVHSKEVARNDVIPHGHVIEPSEPISYEKQPIKDRLPEHFGDLSVVKSVYDIDK